jgi:hypothetical protein
MHVACFQGHLRCVLILSSYGATRTFAGTTAEAAATAFGHSAVAAWLAASRGWTPLHHLHVIDTARARDLLRDGADIYATVGDGGPTPLSLSRSVRACAPGSSVGQLVVAAAEPWSPETHHLFPTAVRARAVTAMLVAQRLCLDRDVWLSHVLPHAVTRQ